MTGQLVLGSFCFVPFSARNGVRYFLRKMNASLPSLFSKCFPGVAYPCRCFIQKLNPGEFVVISCK